MQRRQHAQAEQVELDQTDCRTVILVPLQDAAILHACPLHRAHVGDGTIADHHAPGMDPHVPGQVTDLQRQIDHLPGNILDIRRVGKPVPPADLPAPGILLTLRKAESPCHVPHGAATAVGDDIGHLRRAVTPVMLVDVLDDVLAQVRFDVDVDVGRPVAGRRQEAFEQQLVGNRIHGSDAQRVAHRRIGGRPPALAQDSVLSAEPGDVMHHQEITRELQRRDDVQLALDLSVGPRGNPARAVAVGGTDHHQLPKPAVLGMAVGDVERRQPRRDERQLELALLRQFRRSRYHSG